MRATMRRCDKRLSVGRRALRTGGRVPTLAVLDWTDETEGRRIVSGVASVLNMTCRKGTLSRSQGLAIRVQGSTGHWESV